MSKSKKRTRQIDLGFPVAKRDRENPAEFAPAQIVSIASTDLATRQRYEDAWGGGNRAPWSAQYAFLPRHVYGAQCEADIIRRAIGNRYEVIYRSRLDQRIRLYSSIEALHAALEIAERA